MKRVVAACIILLSMLLCCSVVLLLLRQSIRTLEEDLTVVLQLSEQEKYTEVIPILETTVKRWEKQEHIFSRLLRHKELESVTLSLISLPPYLEHHDYASYYAALRQIRQMLTHVWEAELPILENLL